MEPASSGQAPSAGRTSEAQRPGSVNQPLRVAVAFAARRASRFQLRGRRWRRDTRGAAAPPAQGWVAPHRWPKRRRSRTPRGPWIAKGGNPWTFRAGRDFGRRFRSLAGACAPAPPFAVATWLSFLSVPRVRPEALNAAHPAPLSAVPASNKAPVVFPQLRKFRQ